MAWKYRFRLPMFHCGQSFIFYSFIEQKRSSFKYIAGSILEVVTARWRKLFYRPMMLSDDMLSFGWVEASGVLS